MRKNRKKSSYPLDANITFSATSEIIRITFQKLVAISSMNLRAAPSAAAYLRIAGDEYGQRTVSVGNSVEGVLLSSVTASGGATVSFAKNLIELNQGYPSFFFFKGSWLTRNLYLTASATGNYVFNLVYTWV